ncbi:MAG: hypothetical protein F4193_03840, partial [Candidatus Dadabacteria bacterium]|nr:hypothetical protein [Candidatus Dadabacteria bacterium]
MKRLWSSNICKRAVSHLPVFTGFPAARLAAVLLLACAALFAAPALPGVDGTAHASPGHQGVNFESTDLQGESFTFTQNTQISPLTLPEAHTHWDPEPEIRYSLQGHELPEGSSSASKRLIVQLPEGLSFDATTRMLTGTPTATQEAKNYNYVASATEANNNSSSHEL